MAKGHVTRIMVSYDCERRCSYDVPTAIPATGSALSHASAVDTVVMLVDREHDAACPADAEDA